jgi:hypothetical protein
MIERIVVFGVATVVSFMAAGCQGPAATSEPQQHTIPAATPEPQDPEPSEPDLRDNIALSVVLSPDEAEPEFCSVSPYIRDMKKQTLMLTVVNISGLKNVVVTLPEDIVEAGWKTSAKLNDQEAWTFLLTVPAEPDPNGYEYTVSCRKPDKAGPRVIVP